MEELILVRASRAYAVQIEALRREIAAAGDPDAYAGCSGLDDALPLESWFQKLELLSDAATCPEGMVPSDCYLAVRPADDRVVGVIDLRHHIDHPVLGLWGGHIGYTVRPSERGQGYARQMLRLDLENARRIGLERVLVTCSAANPASEAVIRANGGVYERTVVVENTSVRRFWIDL